jgi:hypothetical protein
MAHAWIGLCLAFSLGLPGIGRAESGRAEPTADLADAERAYQAVDFAEAYRAAQRALVAGHAPIGQTRRLYVLLGTSAAALEKAEEARGYFLVATAMDPQLSLQRTLSPKMRGPYLEALGFWSAYPERLSLRAHPDSAAQRLLIELEDPAHLGARLLVYTRAAGQREYQRHALGTRASQQVPFSQAAFGDGFQYYAQLVDTHDNVLYQLGTAVDPRVAGTLSKPRSPVATHRTRTRTGPAADPGVTNWLVPSLAAGGLISIGAGAYFHHQREVEAATWNSPACERPGSTRLDQCRDVDRRRLETQALAIGFYALGAALGTGSAVLYFRRPRGEATHASSKGARFLVPCGVSVWSGEIVCQGRF